MGKFLLWEGSKLGLGGQCRFTCSSHWKGPAIALYALLWIKRLNSLDPASGPRAVCCYSLRISPGRQSTCSELELAPCWGSAHWPPPVAGEIPWCLCLGGGGKVVGTGEQCPGGRGLSRRNLPQRKASSAGGRRCEHQAASVPR